MDGYDDPPPAYNSLPPMTAATDMSPPHQQQQPTKPVAPAPPPSAMAFTVDFSGCSDGNAATEENKKLDLKDGIGRFAPAKKFTSSANTSSAASAVKASIYSLFFVTLV